MNITTAGIDLAKNVFQVHGIDQRGKAVVRKRLRRKQVLMFFAQLPAVPGWHGSLWWRTLLGEKAAGTGTHGETHGASVREAVCKGEQDGCCRRGGDL